MGFVSDFEDRLTALERNSHEPVDVIDVDEFDSLEGRVRRLENRQEKPAISTDSRPGASDTQAWHDRAINAEQALRAIDDRGVNAIASQALHKAQEIANKQFDH